MVKNLPHHGEFVKKRDVFESKLDRKNLEKDSRCDLQRLSKITLRKDPL